MKLLARYGLLERWQALAERDRKALLIMTVAIVGALFYLSVWQPSTTALTDAKAYYQKERELYDYLLVRTSHMQPQVASLDAAELIAKAQEIAQSEGLIRLKPVLNSENHLEVRVESEQAVSLISWLEQLKQHGVFVLQATLAPQGAGLLSGQLVLGLKR